VSDWNASRRQCEFGTYEAGVFEACCNFWGKGGRDVRVRGCGGSLVVQRRMVAVCHCAVEESAQYFVKLKQMVGELFRLACDRQQEQRQWSLRVKAVILSARATFWRSFPRSEAPASVLLPPDAAGWLLPPSRHPTPVPPYRLLQPHRRPACQLPITPLPSSAPASTSLNASAVTDALTSTTTKQQTSEASFVSLQARGLFGELYKSPISFSIPIATL
jgi:hypothetical protein